MDLFDAIKQEKERRAHDPLYKALDRTYRKLQLKKKPGVDEQQTNNPTTGQGEDKNGETENFRKERIDPATGASDCSTVGTLNDQSCS